LQHAVCEAIVRRVNVTARIVVELNVDEIAVQEHWHWIRGIREETLWCRAEVVLSTTSISGVILSQGNCEIGIIVGIVVFVVNVDTVNDNVGAKGTEVCPIVSGTLEGEGGVCEGWVAEHVPEVGGKCLCLGKRREAGTADSSPNRDEDLFAGGLTCLNSGSVRRAIIYIRSNAIFGCPASGPEVGGREVVGREVFIDEGHIYYADSGILADMHEVASVTFGAWCLSIVHDDIVRSFGVERPG